jgi:hypothetical protein
MPAHNNEEQSSLVQRRGVGSLHTANHPMDKKRRGKVNYYFSFSRRSLV